jgi:hypothetical protein
MKFHWHLWSKWQDTRKGVYITPFAKTIITIGMEKLGDSWIEQESRCLKCGKVRLRTEKA